MQLSLVCSLLVGVAILSSVSAKDDPKKFQAAIDAASTQCKLVGASCFQSSQKAQELFSGGKFCELMTLKDGDTTTKSCMTATGGCTTAEYNKIKDAACGATSAVVSMVALVLGVVVSVMGKPAV